MEEICLTKLSSSVDNTDEHGNKMYQLSASFCLLVSRKIVKSLLKVKT